MTGSWLSRTANVLPDPVNPGGDPSGHRSFHSKIDTLASFLTILLGDESGREDDRLIGAGDSTGS